ncbi:MAG TPA: alpha/beta fold hydrolase, partial [Solirubrobacteraceae bacterium]
VDSGGLGPDVNLMLRAATLPGSEIVLPLLMAPALRRVGAALGEIVGRLGRASRADVQGILEGLESLADRQARAAFVHTARSVMDPAGQRIDARDRLYLSARVPTLIVWGADDRIIPVAHGQGAHALMPSSRFQIFPNAGHFPFNDDPERFVELMSDFMASTEAARLDEAHIREMLRERAGAAKP